MCMAFDADPIEMIWKDTPKARKAHRCDECGRTIRVGETYIRERFKLDGETSTHKTCAHCTVVRDWLSLECGGYVFTAVSEDIDEHARGGYGIGVIRLAVGMRRNWTTRKGALMPVPEIPVPESAHAVTT